MMKCRDHGGAVAFVLLVMFLVAGCDCLRVVNALVLDAETLRPINGAPVRERHGDGTYEDEYFPTDDSGHFEFSDISGGFRCPPVQLHISKDGYVPVDRKFDPGSSKDTVFPRAEPWRYKAR